MNAPATVVRDSLKGIFRQPSGSREWVSALLIIVAVAALTRARDFGSPVAHIDEQFYLFVGRAIVDGQLPYVDVWDRKPIGLFLIYAGISLLGDNWAIQMHLVAGVCAVLTAFVISRIANRFTSPPAGVFAGVIYLLMLPLVGGGTAQSPVFYNLFMATAALIVVRSLQERETYLTHARAAMAMLLVGLSMAVKQTAVFEGFWFGVAFLYADWRGIKSVNRTVRMAALLVCASLAPLALMYATYAVLGHFGDIWQATVSSVLGKQSLDAHETQRLARIMAIRVSVLTLCTAFALWQLRKQTPAISIFLTGWFIAAMVGLFAVPNFYDHYFLPALVPMCVISAVLLGLSLQGVFWTGLVTASSMLITTLVIPNPFEPRGFERASKFEQFTRIVRGHLNGGCLYVYEGPSQLYTATGACTLTRFVFPDHLNSQVESKALPVSPTAEMTRILRQRPAVIVEGQRIMLQEMLPNRRLLQRELACNYDLANTVADWGSRRTQPLNVWVRNSNAKPCKSSTVAIGSSEPRR